MLQSPESAAELAKQLGFGAVLAVLTFREILRWDKERKVRKENGHSINLQPIRNNTERIVVLETHMEHIKEDLAQLQGMTNDLKELVGLMEEYKRINADLNERLRYIEQFRMRRQ